jgi:ABC-type multidrug transport system fused ATPase/permease subunit
MTRLVFELLRPYRARLAIVFVAMLVEIGTSLAAPWPLKLVIDDALGNHHLPHWLDWAHEYGGFGKHTLGVALFAGAATLTIAVVGAISSYIDNYYTTSVGQWVANDLRLRVYEHLHRLSLQGDGPRDGVPPAKRTIGLASGIEARRAETVSAPFTTARPRPARDALIPNQFSPSTASRERPGGWCCPRD